MNAHLHASSYCEPTREELDDWDYSESGWLEFAEVYFRRDYEDWYLDDFDDEQDFA